jgi:non-specific serine/threonine protein kinase
MPLPTSPYPGYLPTPLTSFLGRKPELAVIRQSLESDRLLTLTGPAGCGKTRMALQVAISIQPSFEHGVWWVDLNGLFDPADVPDAVARLVAPPLLAESAHTSLTQALAEMLQEQRLLMILDNCEHLLDGCRVLVRVLRDSCPHLVILATSLQPLGLPFETVIQLEPLPTPPLNAPSDPQVLIQYDSVRLFIERGREISPIFDLTWQNAAEVSTICRRLEGLPLALELAARRVGLLSTAQIAARLNEALHLLSRGAPGAPARHSALRAALDWSYDLLDEKEKILLQFLAIFPAPFTLEMVEAICSNSGSESPELPGSIPRVEIIDLLSSLAEKSLLAIAERNDPKPTRYRLLEPVRQYAGEKLEISEQVASAHEQLLRWSIEHYEQVAPQLVGVEQTQSMDAIEKDHEILRTALRWSLLNRQVEGGMRLVRAVWRYWLVRGYWREGRARCEELLSMADELENSQPPLIAAITPALKARIAYCAGVFSYRQNDWGAALAHGETSLAIAQSLNDRQEQTRALNLMALTFGDQGDSLRAISLLEQALNLNHELNDEWGISANLNNLGSIYHDHLCDYARASQYYQQALLISQRLGDSGLTETFNLGDLALLQGHYAEALSLLERSRQMAIRAGDAFIYTKSLASLGEVARQEGRLDQAESWLQECYQLRRQAGESIKSAYSLRQLGELAVDRGELGEATRLLDQALAQVRALKDEWGISVGLTARARLALEQGQFEKAYYDALESLRMVASSKYRYQLVSALEVLAIAASLSGQAKPAAVWLGCAQRERRLMNAPLPPSERPRLDTALRRIETGLGKNEALARLVEGERLSLADAIRQVLGGMEAPQINTSAEIAAVVPVLHIYALGDSRVEINGRSLTAGDWEYSKAREMLYLLLTHPPMTKEQIGLELWPDASPTQFRSIFHRVLHSLRRALGDPDWITYRNGRYAFDRRPSCWFDLDELETRLARARHTRPNAERPAAERDETARLLLEAVSLWRGDFLANLDTGEWAIFYRENLRQEYILALIDLGQIYFANANYHAAADAYRRVLALDEYFELAHRELMRCFTRLGETGQALRHYRNLCELLNTELNAPPSPETTLLYERIHRGDAV